MKNLCCTTVVLLSSFHAIAQGSSCATAIPLTVDGVCRTYNFSSTTEPSVGNCSYSGNGAVLYFSFTTDPGDPVPCISVETSLSSPANLEASLRRSDCGTAALYHQTVCFNDGNGFWAIDNSYGSGQVSGSSAYFLRFRVEAGFTGQITICAQQPDPQNLACQKATPLTNSPTWYNNSCHVGDTIPAGDVCANTLENTAWYSYTIQGTEEDVLNISAINCDNFVYDDYGYQVGIFTGTCDNLTGYGPCFNDSGGSLQFSLTALPAGTIVYIAIDGKASSNCRYMIWIGLTTPLPAKWGHFSGRALNNGNLLRWSTLEEVNTRHFEIERSENGSVFSRIATVESIGNYQHEKEYSFLDPSPPGTSFYRLKLVDADNKYSYSKTLVLERKSVQVLQVLMQNPAKDMLVVTYDSKFNKRGTISILNNLGQVVLSENYNLSPGQQVFRRPLGKLPGGMYYLISEFGDVRDSKPFVKQ